MLMILTLLAVLAVTSVLLASMNVENGFVFVTICAATVFAAAILL